VRSDKFQQFSQIEQEVYDGIVHKLEQTIRDKDTKINDLKQALQVPRHHYQYVDWRLAEEVIAAKDRILTDLAQSKGVPKEKMLEHIYNKDARKEA
jgi:type II secretory pathway component PulJ